MKTVVIYKSKTGFTKRYAEIIARELNCEAVDFKGITVEKMSEFDTIVYGGGLYAGMVNGMKKAKEMFDKSAAKRFVVFATGGTPNNATEAVDEVWKNNFTDEELKTIPHFYMQSGICYEKMPLPEKALMKMMASVLSKKKNKDNFETGFAEAIKESYDISSEAYAKPLIDFLKENA